MRRSRSFGVLIAVMAAALSWASPAALAATPWFGTYDVSVLGGEQHTSWSFNHVPTSPCDAPGSGQGTDTQTFLPGAPQVAQMSGVGPVAFPGTISNLQLSYTEDREGSITYGQPADPNATGCSVASGGGESTPPTPDCGSRSLSTSIDVTPLPGDPSLQQSPAASTGNEPPYKDCPVFGEVTPAFASPLALTLPPLGPTLAGGAPTGTATLSASEPITDPDVTGESTLKLELRMTPLFAVDPLGMPADAALPVDSSGSTSVPVTCPAGGACSGTVSLAFDTAQTNAIAGRAHAAAAPRFPEAVSGYVIALASAHFDLRARQRGVRLRLHGGRTFAKAISPDTLAVIVSEGSGKKSVRYIAGLAHVRA
jgi:hypothetical protein